MMNLFKCSAKKSPAMRSPVRVHTTVSSSHRSIDLPQRRTGGVAVIGVGVTSVMLPVSATRVVASQLG